MQVLLALHGRMGRLIMSQWLHKIGVFTLEASEWNELTQILQELFCARKSVHDNGFDAQCSVSERLKAKLLKIKDMANPVFIIVVDIGLLNLSTDIWKEQLNFLNNYFGKAKFAWMVYHDTSNAIKMELRRKANVLMVNKPLYKAKMIHILEAVIKETNLEQQKKSSNALRITKEGDLHECLEIDATHFDTASSDDSDLSEMGGPNSVKGFHTGEKQREGIRKPCSLGYKTINNCLEEFTPVYSKENDSTKRDPCQIRLNSHDVKDDEEPKCCTKEASFSIEPQCENAECKGRNLVSSCPTQQGNLYSSKAVNEQKSLEGLRIMLAEDNPVLQRVATIMLEKMGAVVIAVGDGLQAVDSLNCMINAEDCGRESLFEERNTRSQTEIKDSPPYDLILMDCQVRIYDNAYFSNALVSWLS